MCPPLTTWGQVADTRLLPFLGRMEAFIWAPFVYRHVILVQTCLSIDTHGWLWKEPSMCGCIPMPSPSYSRCAQSSEVPGGADTSEDVGWQMQTSESKSFEGQKPLQYSVSHRGQPAPGLKPPM